MKSNFGLDTCGNDVIALPPESVYDPSLFPVLGRKNQFVAKLQWTDFLVPGGGIFIVELKWPKIRH